MTNSTLLTTFLHDVMTARRITFDELTCELEGISPAVVRAWLSGHASPDPTTLPSVAKALRTDLAEVAVGWLIDRLPELHEPLYEAVLKPRRSIFPRRDDLSLRAPERLRSAADASGDVGDPHDEPRLAGAASITTERTLRKRAPKRLATSLPERD